MRLIDADALRRKCAKVAAEAWKMKMTAQVETVMNQFIDFIEETPTVGGWVSVKDRLPREEDYRQCHENWDGAVIWTNGSDIGLGWYYTSTGNWSDIYDCKIDDVTQWMPLPELPKENDTDGNSKR